MLNLLNCRGYEKPLSDVYHYAFTDYVGKASATQKQSMSYVHVDLNEKPKSKSKQNLRQIFQLAKSTIAEHGWLGGSSPSGNWCWVDARDASVYRRRSSGALVDKNGAYSLALQVYREQGGFIRINCLDCLDRTNMIEYLVALRALVLLLAEVGVPSLSPELLWEDDFHVNDIKMVLGVAGLELYRRMWSRNGDAIADICG